MTNEVLAQHPGLARARELFIDLFEDSMPLVNLGYTRKQIAFASPTLRLLEGEGLIETYTDDNPFLLFNSADPHAEWLNVYALPNRIGFELSAHRDEFWRGWGELSRDQRLRRMLTFTDPVDIFQDYPSQVASIALFEDGTDMNDLDYLVRHFVVDSSTRAPMGMKVENPLTRIAKSIGLVGTYRAAWVDEQTKLEFVVKIEAPEHRRDGPDYVTYRKLRPIFDSNGTMTPVGKKANASPKQVTQILSEKKKQVTSGSLAWDNTRS